MPEKTTVEQRAESLRQLAELMTKPDVANFLARSSEMATLPPGVNPMQCSACCSSHGGGVYPK